MFLQHYITIDNKVKVIEMLYITWYANSSHDDLKIYTKCVIISHEFFIFYLKLIVRTLTNSQCLLFFKKTTNSLQLSNILRRILNKNSLNNTSLKLQTQYKIKTFEFVQKHQFHEYDMKDPTKE